MSVLVPAEAAQLAGIGKTVKKTYSAFAAETKDLFNVTGVVLITSLVGYVSTAITVANTVKLVSNPTVGTSSDLCAATDIGTTDTPAGDLIGWSGSPAESLIVGIGAVAKWPTTEPAGTTTAAQTGGASGVYVTAGVLQQVTTGTSPDGAVDWYVSYVPISSDGAITAA
jgi:hypothetical protein